jgi:hypothetical protein
MLVQLAEADAREKPFIIPASKAIEPAIKAPSAARGIAYAVVLSTPFWALVGFTLYLFI